MSEKRQHRRHKRRLTVKFGELNQIQSGFTYDLSIGGMFVICSALPKLDARLHLQVFLDPTKYLLFEGEVRRHKTVPPELRSVERGGFGVRFLDPSELVREAIGASGVHFEVRYATQEEFRRAYATELKQGGVFVRTNQKLERGAKAMVTFRLDFAKKRASIDCSVVHVSRGETGQGPSGVGLTFDDKEIDEDFKLLL